MLISILASESVLLSELISWILGTTKAGSRARRFTRWLDNSSIEHHVWYTLVFLGNRPADSQADTTGVVIRSYRITFQRSG